MQTEEEWFICYNLAKKYYAEHGNLLIPATYVTKDENGNSINLGFWFKSQKRKSTIKLLNKHQITLLDEFHSIIKSDEIISDDWIKKYNLAKKYYEEYGNLLVPQAYIVIDEEGKSFALGYWVNAQRYAYRSNNLFRTKIDLLNQIDMVYYVGYYRNLVKQLDMEYNLYQYGLLDDKNIEELVDNKHLIYDDSNKIVKGNAIVLSRKLAA